MSHSPDSPTLIIGVGNPYRHDDGAGLAVARQLVESTGLATLACVIELNGEGTSLIESWRDWHTVILVDAVSSGSAVGTVHCYDCNRQTLSTEIFTGSSHAFGVAQAIELARALDQLPPSIIVYGIEGQNFSPGIGLSSEIQNAVSKVSATIIASLTNGK